MSLIPLETQKKESYKIFDEIAGTYDFLNHLLSMGLDTYWRKKFIAKLPKKSNLRCLDLACGTGDVPITLAKDKRVKNIIGIDLSKEMVELGRAKVKKRNLEDKIDLRIGDATAIDFEDKSFDVVTISFGIRNFFDPNKSLREIQRVLKPGGKLLIMEFALPESLIIKKLYLFYFRYILPFIGNFISKHVDAYTYLNKSVEQFPYGDNFLVMLEQANFCRVDYGRCSFGVAMLYQGVRCD
ncbi:MAG: bifunctional demethylmenaquinone methyltransferase/2-methoxy-6-polyprenyl-1,4-benzoquinol methylase UbiE [Bacteriovoracaceae bacterium]|nr:bifunctional demethylmenaquinone methyltransferase/2-methoxy-6-polyprenyl-1,4-benzoquinol methylase UbiE [Bacteriovoracaceae bacterium]